MAFFSKKQNEELFSLIESTDVEGFKIGASHVSASPNALTPEELSGTANKNGRELHANSALDALKKRMSKAAEPPFSISEGNTQTEITAEINSDAGTKSSRTPMDKIVMQGAAVTVDELMHNSSSKASPSELSDESITNGAVKNSTQMQNGNAGKESGSHTVIQQSEEKTAKTLLEKCRPYILDEDGKDTSASAPTYKLESVAEILSSQSKKTLEKLSEKYDITFDDLGKYNRLSADAERAVKGTQSAEKALSSEKPKAVTPAETEPEIFEESIPLGNTVNNIHTNISGIISDLDAAPPKITETKTAPEHTATIKFIPVSDSDSSQRISISSQTRPIDLTGELTQISDVNDEKTDSEVRLEQTEYEDYIPEEEFESETDAKRFTRMLSLKKRSSFLAAAFSVIFTLILCAAKLPFLSGIILAHTRVSMIICTALTAATVIANFDMFKSLPKIFSRHSSADIPAVLASVSVLAYAVTGIIKTEITTDILLLLGIILSLRAISRFWKSSYILSNFKQIAVSSPKRAVKLISDSAVTFAMAKNSIEGDVLAAAPQRTEHICDYMKYSTFGIFFGGRLPAVTVLSLILSVITGFACATYFDGVIYGLYSAAVIECLAALPVIFLIDNLPLYSAAKRLNRIGAMIAGKTGAERIENANAAVFSADEIFPSGTVTLHQMKVLSENSLDDTIIRAASLTDCLGSPLSPIFKKIAGTGNITSLPDSDTVKYEDRMGISGWVDNKLLFIGNRTLMEAHGISVPSVEVDRKLLRQGYFPVYVASEDTACALLAVQYSVNPEIAHELRRLSALGVTMLINSSDPNLTEEMICDYMGLYEDSVKVMSSAGCHMYKNSVTFTKRCSAPAAYKGNPAGLAAIMTSACRIKKSNTALTILYSVFSVIGAILFAYMSFDGSGTLISSIWVLIYNLVCTVISYILYLTFKP